MRDALVKSLIGAILAIPVLLDRQTGGALGARRRARSDATHTGTATRGEWLMYLRRDEVEPERRTSPLALRISIITGIAIAIFSVLFLRLWYVQVLSGDKYRTQANDNRIREIRVQAPRGDILDRNGKVLVANRTELADPGHPAGPARRRARPLPRAAPARDGHRHGHEARSARSLPAEPRRARRPGDPEEGPRGRQGLLPAREPVELPGRERGAGVHARVPQGDHRRPPLRERRRGDGPAAQGAALFGPASRATRSASRGSSTSTTASFAAGPAPTASRSTHSAGRPGSSQASRPSRATTYG